MGQCFDYQHILTGFEGNVKLYMFLQKRKVEITFLKNDYRKTQKEYTKILIMIIFVKWIINLLFTDFKNY